jgi:hypothetical protein
MKNIILTLLLASSVAFAQTPAPAPKPEPTKPVAAKPVLSSLPDAEKVKLLKANSDFLAAQLSLVRSKEYQDYQSAQGILNAAAEKIKADHSCKEIDKDLNCVK